MFLYFQSVLVGKVFRVMGGGGGIADQKSWDFWPMHAELKRGPRNVVYLVFILVLKLYCSICCRAFYMHGCLWNHFF